MSHHGVEAWRQDAHEADTGAMRAVLHEIEVVFHDVEHIDITDVEYHMKKAA